MALSSLRSALIMPAATMYVHHRAMHPKPAETVHVNAGILNTERNTLHKAFMSSTSACGAARAMSVGGIVGPHSAILTDVARERFTLKLFDELWARYFPLSKLSPLDLSGRS